MTLVAALGSLPIAQVGPAERFWPQWRGPYATGISRTATPPLEWSETRNIRWKREIPGRGSGSPVVWGDRIFLMSAVPVGVDGGAAHESRASLQPRDVHRFVVMAIDRRTGRTVWERTAQEERPRQPSMKDGTWASSSPITDGQRVYVNETGNPGMATAGAGDVLAGILAAYLAACFTGIEPTWTPFEASISAVYVHGLAGDLAVAETGRRGMIASDLVRFLSTAQSRLH